MARVGVVWLLWLLLGCGDHGSEMEREQDFNFGWQFYLARELTDTPAQEAHWQPVRLPHDWSIAADFDAELDGATAYLPGGVGWYRKQFSVDAQTGTHYLMFDGIYNHSTIWLNGKEISHRVNGYTPFYVDISPYLATKGQTNTLLVRVDRHRYVDSRWYPGSGIYREVKLLSVPDVHLAPWGIFIQTPKPDTNVARADVRLTLVNKSPQKQPIEAAVEVFSQNGQLVAHAHAEHQLAASSETEILLKVAVESPHLWSPEHPYLYQYKVKIRRGDQLVDASQTQFGFRSFEFDPERGFFLNGAATPIHGVNLHHDGGAVGAAVPDDVWRRRLQKLKSAGVNALRLAHNPSSENMLNLADEMGFLVQVELFDEWDYPKDKRLNQWSRHDDEVSRGYAHWFQSEAENDLKLAVRRDRNHTSVFMWSIGNEIEWTYPRYKEASGYFDMNASGNYFYNPPFISAEEIKRRFNALPAGEYQLAKTAKKLSAWVKQMDKSRPVTANLILPSVSHQTGYADALDVVGYSYRRVIYDYGHERYPNKMIYGSENVPQWHEWLAAKERVFIPGVFLWTGVDYLGESHDAWPRKAVESGLLDSAGFASPSYHLFKSLWNDEPHIHITSQTEALSLYRSDGDAVVEKEPGQWARRVWIWQEVNSHWNYTSGESVIVELLTNCPAVELFLNGNSLGVKKLADNPDHELKWAIAYEEGELLAKGLGDCQTSDSLVTAHEPASLALESDRATLALDGYQVAHLVARVEDVNEVLVRHQAVELQVDVSANLELLGVDNGNSRTMQGYRHDRLTSDDGKALILVRRIGEGPATVKVTSPGLSQAVHRFPAGVSL